MTNILTRYFQLDKKGRWVINFGQYDGTFLDDIADQDPEYLEWILSRSDFPSLVKEVVSVALGGG